MHFLCFLHWQGDSLPTAVTIKTHGMAIDDPFEEIKFVICDRPFAYAIVDTETGLPVFLGTVETV